MIAQMTANQRIREARKTLKLTQTEFAKEIFVSTSYIPELENGHRIANDRILHLISMTFGISEAWLKTGEGTMFNRTPEQKTERILSLFNELNPHFQEYVLKQLDQLIALQNVSEQEEPKE
jgi:transcriptional regulator with XRE-family HTH domain